MTSGCFGPVSEETVGEEGVRIIVTTELSAAAKGFLSASGLGHLVCSGLPPNPVTKPDMLSAAVFLAAGADKSSPVTLDEIINVNNYLGVNIVDLHHGAEGEDPDHRLLRFQGVWGAGRLVRVHKGDRCVQPQ